MYDEHESILRRTAILSALALFVVAGCASVETTSEYGGAGLPRPDRILVYDFAYSPGQVTLDPGLSAKLTEARKGEPRSVEELDVGRKAAHALAEHIVHEIRKLGLPAERASGAPPSSGNVLVIKGQFTSIDEGNQTKRVVIGLMAGRSEVKTHVQVYAATDQGRQMVESFETDAKSAPVPGMAETMGAGAVAGHLAASAVASTALHGLAEVFMADVDGDAKATAKELVEKLSEFFVRQGWITPEAVE
jgi:hypothetical protein